MYQEFQELMEAVEDKECITIIDDHSLMVLWKIRDSLSKKALKNMERELRRRGLV